MYYKCYINNDINDPFIPDNVGVYRINIYYNKYKNPTNNRIEEEVKSFIKPLKDNTIGKYVITYNKPSSIEYQQITKLGNYQ